MTLTESVLRQIEDPTLTRDGRARLRCQIAADFEHRGQYEAAREALGELWRGLGQRPDLAGLGRLAAAEVLLRAGALSGWLGSVEQIEGSQDDAKDLISESIDRFRALGDARGVAAAQNELGLCYRRAGAHDEARVVYQEALKGLAEGRDNDLRAVILLRLAMVDLFCGRYSDALRILLDAGPIFEDSDNAALKGKFHNSLAAVLTCMAKAEHRSDHTDRAIIEYTAAAHYFDLSGHTSFRARAENNLGLLLHTTGRHAEAHEHLNLARRLLAALKDRGSVAQVDETHTRVLLAEGRTREAERVISDAVRTMEKGGEPALLAEALTTQGRVLAKLGDFALSQSTLRRAADLAEQAGAIEDAGRSLLSLIEEHADRLDERDLLETYQRANNLLRETQDAETITRLRECADRIVSARLAVNPFRRGRSVADFWANFNLPDRVHAYEARYIRRALVDAEGSVTRAARLLGFSHHANLVAILAGRHTDLAHLRTPPEKRRRSIMRSELTARQSPAQTRPARILHVEDNKAVSDMGRDALEKMSLAVVTCADGARAMEILAGNEPFDLLIFDYDLPGRNGIELIRYGRTLAHRRRVPFIMLSAGNVESEAWGAGVDAFLRKPEDVGDLTATVARLLTKTTG